MNITRIINTIYLMQPKDYDNNNFPVKIKGTKKTYTSAWKLKNYARAVTRIHSCRIRGWRVVSEDTKILYSESNSSVRAMYPTHQFDNLEWHANEEFRYFVEGEIASVVGEKLQTYLYGYYTLTHITETHITHIHLSRRFYSLPFNSVTYVHP